MQECSYAHDAMPSAAQQQQQQVGRSRGCSNRLQSSCGKGCLWVQDFGMTERVQPSSQQLRVALSFCFSMLPECADCLVQPCRHTQLHIRDRERGVGTSWGTSCIWWQPACLSTSSAGQSPHLPTLISSAAVGEAGRHAPKHMDSLSGGPTSTPCACTHSRPCSPPQHPACTGYRQRSKTCSAVFSQMNAAKYVHTLGSKSAAHLTPSFWRARAMSWDLLCMSWYVQICSPPSTVTEMICIKTGS